MLEIREPLCTRDPGGTRLATRASSWQEERFPTWGFFISYVGIRKYPRGGETIPPKFHLIPPKFHFVPTWGFFVSYVGIRKYPRGDLRFPTYDPL